MLTPGHEAESLMGNPLSFVCGSRPLKQTNVESKRYSITVPTLDFANRQQYSEE